MAINPRLRALLDRHGVRYEVVHHRGTQSLGAAALHAHVPADHVAHVFVMRDAHEANLMLVLPASLPLDACVARGVTHHTGLYLEQESELVRLFPDCEIGAMPPVGHLYGLPMFVDPCLVEGQEEIWFEAGNRHELVRMRVEDFERIAQPFACEACLHREEAAVAV